MSRDFLTQAEIDVMGDDWNNWHEVTQEDESAPVQEDNYTQHLKIISMLRQNGLLDQENQSNDEVTPVVGYEHCHHCKQVYKSEDMSFVCTNCAHSGCDNCVKSFTCTGLEQVFTQVVKLDPRDPEFDNPVFELNGETMCSKCWRQEIAEMLM